MVLHRVCEVFDVSVHAIWPVEIPTSTCVDYNDIPHHDTTRIQKFEKNTHGIILV